MTILNVEVPDDIKEEDLIGKGWNRYCGTVFFKSAGDVQLFIAIHQKAPNECWIRQEEDKLARPNDLKVMAEYLLELKEVTK